MQGIGVWVGRVVLGSVVTVVTLELGLFALSGYEGRRARPVERPDADMVVLCVGDSHTYGAPLPEAESYPSQLQARLKATYPDKTFSVINLGVPGANTRMIRNRLPEWLDRYQPDVLLLWAGINNSWNVAETDRESGLQGLLFRSRVWRLISRLRFDRANARGDGRADLLEAKDGGSRWQVAGQVVETRRAELRTEDWQPGLEADLIAIAELARERNVRISWMTYPVMADHLRAVNETIQQVGKSLQVFTVDGSFNVMVARKQGHVDSELMVDAAGPHPTGLLYSYFVDSLMAHMAIYLGTWNGGPAPGILDRSKG